MKDELDTRTLELPLLETPLQILKRYLRKHPSNPPQWDWGRIQAWERAGRAKGDLEMLIACRDWRKEQARGSSTRSEIKATVIPLWIHRR